MLSGFGKEMATIHCPFGKPDQTLNRLLGEFVWKPEPPFCLPAVSGLGKT